jgi:hypothetical protein
MKHIKLFEEFINESTDSYITVKLSQNAANSFEKELKSNSIKYKKVRPTVFEVEPTPKANIAIKLTKERFRSSEIIVEEFIVEKSGDSYSSGCVMLYFDFPEMNDIHRSIDSNDLYEEDGDRTFGLENEPHVTLLYGLKKDVTPQEVKEILDQFNFNACKLHNVSLFENEYDVLKFDVDGDDLYEANKALCNLPYENSFPDYHPHATIGYLKKGAGKKYCDKMKGLEYELAPSHAIFSQPDGTKTQIAINN